MTAASTASSVHRRGSGITSHVGAISPYSVSRPSTAGAMLMLAGRRRSKGGAWRVAGASVASVAAAIFLCAPPDVTRAWFAAIRRGSRGDCRLLVRLLVRSSLLVLLRSSTAGFLTVRSVLELASSAVTPVVRMARNFLSVNSIAPIPPSIGCPTTGLTRLPDDVADRILNSVGGFSFSACAWLMYYQIGAVRALADAFGLERLTRTGGDGLQEDGIGFAGASSGSLLATALVCGIPLEEFQEFSLGMADQAAMRFGGPVGNMSTIVRGGLERFLTQDAGDQVARPGRLTVCVTSLRDFLPSKRILTGSVGLGSTKEELISVLMSSCYIPIYYEDPPLFWDPSGYDRDEDEDGVKCKKDDDKIRQGGGGEVLQEEEKIEESGGVNKEEGKGVGYAYEEEEEKVSISEKTSLAVCLDTDGPRRSGFLAVGLDGGVSAVCPPVSSGSKRSSSRPTVQVSPYRLHGKDAAPPPFHPRSIEPSSRYSPNLALFPEGRSRCKEILRDGYDDAADWIREEARLCGCDITMVK